jgi:hypothetical protein
MGFRAIIRMVNPGIGDWVSLLVNNDPFKML